MTTNDEIRAVAGDTDVPKVLPQDRTYQIVASRPTAPTEPVSDEIDGKYHAMYMLHQLKEECGYAGVSLYMARVRECDACGYRGHDFSEVGRSIVCGGCGERQDSPE